jgi:predicted acyltransferase
MEMNPAQPASPVPPNAAGSSKALTQRLLSLDALRGFIMFWIVGGEDIVQALHKVSRSGWADLLARQMDHKKWEGVAFYDLIFPSFVFMVGVSLVFSLSRTIAESGKAAAYSRILSRSLLLYLLGIFYYGGFAGGFEKIRLLGVLQRLALCYLFAGLIFCTFRLRGMIVCGAALLIGYWALMTFVPVPGAGAGNFEEGKNLANYIDRKYLPLFKWDGDHDPEGLLSTLPAIANCLLGVFAGLLLRNTGLGAQKKVSYLLVGGVASVLLGFLWGWQFPVVKKIWTSSYVLVAAGYSSIFLAVFYQVIEVWNMRQWAMPFVWIGVNPITIYLAHNLIDFPKIARRFAGGPIEELFGPYGEVVITLVTMLMTFAIVRFLYRRKIFLRV